MSHDMPAELVVRAVLSMDLSDSAIESLAKNIDPKYTFTEVIASIVLGCAPWEVSDTELAVVRYALYKREVERPNE